MDFFLFIFTDLSPASSRDAHMVLVLDLLDTEQHGPLTAKAIEQNGHVRYSPSFTHAISSFFLSLYAAD